MTNCLADIGVQETALQLFSSFLQCLGTEGSTEQEDFTVLPIRMWWCVTGSHCLTYIV